MSRPIKPTPVLEGKLDKFKKIIIKVINHDKGFKMTYLNKIKQAAKKEGIKIKIEL